MVKLFTKILVIFLIAVISSTAVGESVSKIAKEVLPSVILVKALDSNGKQLAEGSGFVVAKGIVATNFHIIKNASSVYIKIAKKSGKVIKRKASGTVATNPSSDLALISVKGLELKPLHIADNIDLSVGTRVYVAENPFSSHALGRFYPSRIGNINRFNFCTLMYFNVSSAGGTSGGPVIDDKGQIIGINVACKRRDRTMYFAIPSKAIARMLEKRHSPRPFHKHLSNKKINYKNYHNFWDCIATYTHKKVKQDNVNSMELLGMLYRLGMGVPRNSQESTKWYHKAAEKGNIEAMVNLGFMYAIEAPEAPAEMYNNDKRLHKWYAKEAIKWWRNSAKQGSALGAFKLYEWYYYGMSVSKDYHKAVVWCRKSIKNGSFKAMVRLSMLYDRGYGVPKNYHKATELLYKAAKSGYGVAMERIGRRYQFGPKIPRDVYKAAKWYHRAANLGFYIAMGRLGYLYSKNSSMPQDYHKATKWFRNAAIRGDTLAMYRLGYSYEDGRGIDQNYHQAVKWYLKAANRRSANAMYRLALLYFRGNGFKKNDIESYMWACLAIKCGKSHVEKFRNHVKKQLTAQEIDKAEKEIRKRYSRLF